MAAGLLLAGTAAAAVPLLSIDAVSLRPGQTTNLLLRLSTPAEGYAGFNTVLWLPQGFTVRDVFPGTLLPTNKFSLYYTVAAHGSGSALALVATAPSNTMTVTGVMCTVSVSVASTALPGNYPIQFATDDPAADVNARHALANSNGTQSVAHNYSNSTVGVWLAPGTGDANGNGIPDWWEVLYFGGTTNISSLTDADHDGLTDYFECLAGTNPTNALSCLRIDATSKVTAPGRDMVFRWYSIPDALYGVQVSTNLHNVAGWVTIEADIPATPPLNVHTGRYETTGTPVFFRLEAH